MSLTEDEMYSRMFHTLKCLLTDHRITGLKLAIRVTRELHGWSELDDAQLHSYIANVLSQNNRSQPIKRILDIRRQAKRNRKGEQR